MDRRRWALFALLLGVAACGPRLPDAPTYPDGDTDFDPPAPVEMSGVADDMPPPNVLLPGDTLKMQMVSQGAPSAEDLLVDPTGHVHVALGGDVLVGGLGLGEAEVRIEAALRRYVRFVRVALSPVGSAGHRVTIVGAVEKPGAYELRPGARVAEVIASAGGMRMLSSAGELAEAGDLDAARIVRAGKVLPVSVGRALRGEPLHNVYLHAEDLIFVPWSMGQQIPVLGFVRTPRNVPFHAGMRLSEALAAAGGPLKTADGGDIRVIRGSLAHPRVYRANLDAFVAGKGTDVVLLGGDVVFVTEHWFATVTDVVNRLTPSLAAAAVAGTLLKPTSK
jgi:polysaccharide export outer membrane protein